MRKKIIYQSFFVICSFLITGFLAGQTPASADPLFDPANVGFRELITGLSSPVDIVNAGDNSGRLFVVEQTGRIRIIKNGALLPTPFLDIHSMILSGGEQGLLSLAFHPLYGTNGQFFVIYNVPKNGDPGGSNLVLEKFMVSANPDVANPGSGVILLTVPHPTNSNHNGGSLRFGPTPPGYLYWSIGDGGSGGDPPNNAQNLTVLLGKIIRLDVNNLDPGLDYGIPPSNPFFGDANLNTKKIWAYGLRNPWRFSFDRQTGDMLIGDVGQNAREEIDFQPAASAGGQNYGWKVMEGMICFFPSSGCNQSGKTLPIIDYDHSLGCAVTGGYVYRGALYPPMQGQYFYSDICSGNLFSLHYDIINGLTANPTIGTPYSVSTFGQDEQGELYFTDYGAGKIYQMCYGPAASPSCIPTTISGNAGVGGVTLSYLEGNVAKTAMSMPDGSYAFMVPYNWSGTVTPTKECYLFTPSSRSYSNVVSNQTAQNYTQALDSGAGCVGVDVTISGVARGTYGIPTPGSERVNYPGLDSGPVVVKSAGSVNIISALRDAWVPQGGMATTSFAQLMGLPVTQVSDRYLFPAYNNVTLNEQLRIGNVDTVDSTVTVTIGGSLQGSYLLHPGDAVRVNYAGLDDGPVVVQGTFGVDIIAALRDAWVPPGSMATTSFVQLMGLPATQLSDTYLFPAYNNVTLNEQLRIGNVDTVDSTVTVTIGGILRGTYLLHPSEAVRVNYAGLDSGPVIVDGTDGVDIISAIRDAWATNGTTTSFAQLMGLPAGQLSDQYIFPAYNNVTLNEQLRIGNVDTVASNVTVTIGGVLQGSYLLLPGEAVRVNYAVVDDGPVVVQGTSGVDIIAALRDAWMPPGGMSTTSFTQLMGLPATQLSDTYLFPAYNNVTLNEQLRIGVP